MSVLSGENNLNAHTPKHIAIIMDGNGRWAAQRKLSRIFGHRAGADAVRQAIELCIDHKIEVLTLFALSVENFSRRPTSEVQLLMSLFLESLQKNISELHQNNVRVQVIGNRSVFNQSLLEQIVQAEQMTKDNIGLNLVIAINYSGQWDIVQAIRNLYSEVETKQFDMHALTQEEFAKHLCLSDLPEPDLLIRTSGEQRISNFMLWQLAYTEIFFTESLWPDFNKEIFQEALIFYQSRERRFGQTGPQVELQHA